jgi:short-subunit dehydrogenase
MVVVISGASAGIGRALAVHLGRRRARLVLSARREERLNALNAELGGGHLVVPADVSRTEDCARLIARAVEHFGRVDTLVCNAGYGIARAVAETTPQEMRQILETNLFGTTDMIRAVTPIMRAQEPRDGWRGQIMIVSSAAGRRGLPYFGAYSATKAAQLSIAEALRVELQPEQVAVTSVHPIGTKTEFFGVAEQLGGMKITPPSAFEVRQTASRVAAAMVDAIRRPTAEVWPFWPARFVLGLGTMMPGVVDWIMARQRGLMRQYNEPATPSHDKANH